MRTAQKALIAFLLTISAWLIVFVIVKPSGRQPLLPVDQIANVGRPTLGLPTVSTPTPFRPLPPGETVELYASTINLSRNDELIDLNSDSPPLNEDGLLTPSAQSMTAASQDELSDPNLNSSQSLYGIDFSPSRKRITIKIQPPDKRVNKGEPIVIRFYPGEKCKFGDKKGCVVEYQPDEQSQVLFVSVHSGVGGQAQRLRSALEGTGLNRAKYKIEKVTENLEALSGAQVTITQGDIELSDFRLMVAARLPGSVMEEYFTFPAQEALATAAEFEAKLSAYVIPGQPQLVIETCGWRMPGEKADPVVEDTSASIYLVVIQRVP